MYYIHPEPENIQALLTDFPADKAVIMLNLLRFSEQAHYEPADGATPCTGAEAFARYGAAVAPLLEAAGARLVWQGKQNRMVIGPDDKDWHLIILMQYPSAQAFVDMVTSDEYRAIGIHRTAALDDSRLIAMEEIQAAPL